jgi:hypothetical protein
MRTSGFPADRLNVLQRFASGSLWSRDPEYRSEVASLAGFTRLLTAERDERGRFKRATAAPRAVPPEPALIAFDHAYLEGEL